MEGIPGRGKSSGKGPEVGKPEAKRPVGCSRRKFGLQREMQLKGWMGRYQED